MGLNLTGTARYVSINAHKGMQQSRRDDLEAVGHMLFYFLLGQLPWSGLDAKNKVEKYKKICEKKEAVKPSTLCEKFPTEFATYLIACRKLGFKERPDYGYFTTLFRSVRSRFNTVEDWSFQWNLNDRPPRGMVPLKEW